MNSTRRILDAQVGTRFTAASNRSDAAATADFRSALSNANAAAFANQDGTAPRHVVKAGETLYGIARARLAADGQPATPGATMRYVLQIAQANDIRNPDRIHPGQQIALAPSAAGTAGRSEPARVVPEDAALSAAGTMRRFYDLDDGHEISDAVSFAESSTDDDAVIHASPSAEISASAAATTDDRLPSVPAASTRADLALYQQALSAAAPSKPPVELPDVVYKGIVGKALDLVPLEPSTRTGLQQANAILSGSFAGRTIAALTGVGGPLLTVAGLVWGIFSAQKISAMQAEAPGQLAQTTSDQIVR